MAYKARKRYGLTILNYMVTGNHVHLLVLDDGKRNVIPESMKLLAGRTAQEYNQRKNRKGACWEDRYHATAIESGDHLARCMVYIDTNMFRAGVADHPSKWSFSGYNEIHEPRRKNVLINYERLMSLFGTASYEQFRQSHKGWISEYISDGEKDRKDEWTASIAVGSRPFVKKVKSALGFRAKGRKVVQSQDGCRIREAPASYNVFLRSKNEDNEK